MDDHQQDWYPYVGWKLASSAPFKAQMDGARRSLDGVGSAGYSKTTGPLLAYESLEAAQLGLQMHLAEHRRSFGYQWGLSKTACEKRGIYTPIEKALVPQFNALTKVGVIAHRFIGPSLAAPVIFDAIRQGQSVPLLPAPAQGDPPAPLGAVASRVHEYLTGAGVIGSPAAQRQSWARVAPRDVDQQRFTALLRCGDQSSSGDASTVTLSISSS